MDPFSRYLLALHLAFAMPSSPPAIFTPPGVPSPSAPGAVHAAPSPSPATPAIIHAAPSVAGGLEISGTSNPNVNGPLIEGFERFDLNYVSGQSTLDYWTGSRYWSTDGTGTKSQTGLWVLLYGEWLVTPADATIDEILPPENYFTEVGHSGLVSQLEIQNAGLDLYVVYQLETDGTTKRWTVYTYPSDLIDVGDTVIPAGTWIRCKDWRPSLAPDVPFDFVGGLGATWSNSPSAQWIWKQKAFYGGSTFNYTKTWRAAASANHPLEVATWTPLSGAGGSFAIASSGLSVPPAIHSPPGHTPGTPGVIHAAPARTPGNPPIITP